MPTRTGLSPALAGRSSPFRFTQSEATGLVRVRSPLLTESRLMSFPTGTEMFQFPAFALLILYIQIKSTCVILRMNSLLSAFTSERARPATAPRRHHKGARLSP